MKKSIWNEKPLNKLDLLAEVEKRQRKDKQLTKMDIFRVLSKKYKNILTPDQFNFRYNYLIDKKKKQEKKLDTSKNKDFHEFCHSMIANEFRDKDQKLLNINKALYEMIDNKKFVKFCDTQVKLQKQRKASGGLSVIFRKLAKILNQNEHTISSKYYFAKKNLDRENNQIETLNSELSRYQGTIIMLEDKLASKEKDNNYLKENYNGLVNNYKTLEKENHDYQTTLYQLKEKPLVKLSLFIDSIINSVKERM